MLRIFKTLQPLPRHYWAAIGRSEMATANRSDCTLRSQSPAFQGWVAVNWEKTNEHPVGHNNYEL